MPTTAHYKVRVLPEALELEVALRLTGLTGLIALELPTWLPGAYGFMKYGRDLFNVRAQDSNGEEILISRHGWQGWRLNSNGGEILITWRAFAHDSALGELSGILDHTHGVLLGTRYLFAPAHEGPVTVDYQLPSGWKMHHPSGAKSLTASSFEYPSYSLLLDTPIAVGAFEQHTRDSNGTPFHFIFLDTAVGYETELSGFLDGIMRIAEETKVMFGSYPFECYSFIFTFNPKAGWGLEHANATQIAFDQDTFISPQARFDAMRVCAHELFHAWNVCRLKPAPLGKIDHAHGSFPDALWVSEGFTRYYEFVLSARANESDAAVFFSNVVNYYRHLTAMPAYQRVSAKDSSLTTFLNHNKYPGSVNNTVDYYDLGMLIAFDLDATLRLNGGTLEAAFREFYDARVGQGDGFTSRELIEFLIKKHPALEAVCRNEIEHAGRLTTETQLTRLGFELVPESHPILGMVLQDDKGPGVANILDDAPAAAAGLAPGDEILRAGGHPFSLSALKWLIKTGAPVELEVNRGHRGFTFTIAPVSRSQIGSLVWRGSDEQKSRLAAWLGKFDFAPGAEIPLTHYDNFHGVQTVI